MEPEVSCKRNYINALKNAISTSNEHLVDFILLNPCPCKDFDINDATEEDENVLHYAIKHGNPSIVKALLQAGACPHLPNKLEQCPLQICASKGFTELIKVLVWYGADLNHRDSSLLTPLQVAALSNNLQLVEWMILNGADPYLSDEEGYTPLHTAACLGNSAVCHTFVVAARTALAVCSRERSDRLSLHEHRPNKKDKSFRKRSQSQYHPFGQSYSEKLNVTESSSKVNMEVGSYIMEKIDDLDGWSPLHMAASEGHLETVLTLTSLGADVRSRAFNGDTPLHTAAARGYLDIIEHLLSKGASVQCESNSGKTPIEVAIYYGYTDVVYSLIKAGAKVDLSRYPTMHCPIYLCAIEGNLGMLSLLASAGCIVSPEVKSVLTSIYYLPKDVVDQLSHIPTLKLMTLQNIRAGLSPRLQENAHKLPLPQSLIRELVLSSLELVTVEQ